MKLTVRLVEYTLYAFATLKTLTAALNAIGGEWLSFIGNSSDAVIFAFAGLLLCACYEQHLVIEAYRDQESGR